MFTVFRSLIVASLVLLCQISFAQFSQIKEKKIDQKSFENATALGEKLMNGMKSGSYYLLSEDEAIEAMIKGLSAETQKSVYEKVKSENGNFENMEYAEALQPDNNKGLTVYRFKGHFDQDGKMQEIRIVINKDYKLSGFWILPWKESIETP